MAKSEKEKMNTPAVENTATIITGVYLAFTPCHFSFNKKEYSLHNNETYDLPDCKFVKSLIAQGRFVKK
jgi:hypothetical protein